MKYNKWPCILLFGILPLITSNAQTDSLQWYYQQSQEAHKGEDWPKFLKTTAAANRLRPFHPTLTYNLAAAYSLNQQPDKAVKYLRSFLLMNSTADFSADPDFAFLMEKKEAAGLLRFQQELNESISQSELVFDLESDPFHPECIAYSEVGSTYYLGGVHQAEIRSYRPGQEQSELFLSTTDLAPLYCVLGMAIDPDKNSLWLVSTSLPQMKGYEETKNGRSSVFEVDLTTKEVLTSIKIEADSRLSELLFHKGRVYIADGMKNTVYTLVSGDQSLTPIADLSADARNLQGMALSPKRGALFVVDYVSGLFKIDLTDGSYQRVPMADHVPFKGIDGLFFHKNSLLVTQNGSRPMRVMRLILDKKQDQVIDRKIIDQNQSYLNEPTQGFIFKKAFYFLANSPWGAYDKKMNFLPEQVRSIQVRKLKL